MKKALLAALGFLVSVAALSAAPLLIEAYQEGQIYIPEDGSDTAIAAEVSFSVDSTCYVQLTAGAHVMMTRLWLESDGDSLPPSMLCVGVPATPHILESVDITYTYLLEPGEHIISLRAANYWNENDPTICRNAYLQALIFLPDTTSAVAEQPTSDAEPSVNTPSLISKGPFVNVAGASELVDATGRVIENAIENDKVYLSNLSTGTYFARDGERTVVKIVKVQ